MAGELEPKRNRLNDIRIFVLDIGHIFGHPLFTCLLMFGQFPRVCGKRHVKLFLFFFFFLSFCFLEPCPQHMEFPRLGVE